MIISVPVHTATWYSRGVGRLAPTDVGAQVSVDGLYRPPVLRKLVPSSPPQTIISVPVQTVVWRFRPAGRILLSPIGLVHWSQPATVAMAGRRYTTVGVRGRGAGGGSGRPTGGGRWFGGGEGFRAGFSRGRWRGFAEI